MNTSTDLIVWVGFYFGFGKPRHSRDGDIKSLNIMNNSDLKPDC